MEWYCTRCWRHEELFVDMPEEEAIRIGIERHRIIVGQDMMAVRVPAGMEAYRGQSFMDKYPAKDCVGDIHVGTIPKHKERFNRKLMRHIDFKEE